MDQMRSYSPRFRLGRMRRPIDAHMPQAFQGHHHRALARAKHRVKIDPPLCHDALLDHADRARCERRQTLLGSLQFARTDLAVGRV
jgi:hypothetical protein